ncbi:hypothetical protein BKI52_30875 [marine bacterium AO1-C]|nr:hypothetical protein BKI52_30875 [marine bacterium AO1-C]
MKKLSVLVGLSLILLASCTQQKPKKEGLEIIWEQGKLPFWQFLKGLSLTYDEKVGVREGRNFNTYGKVTLINHHKQTVRIRSLKDIMWAFPDYYLPIGSVGSSLHPYPMIRLKTQKLSPGDTLRLYLVFRQKEKAYFEKCDISLPVDSIDYSLKYHIIDGKQSKKDSSAFLNFRLIKTKKGEFELKTITKGAEQSSSNKPKVKKTKLSKNSLKQDFDDFLAKFPSISLKKVYDLPQIAKQNIPPDSTQTITDVYMRRFVRRNLKLYGRLDDTLTNFVKKKTLLRLSGQYVGKLDYPNKNQMTVVLVKLFDSNNYYTTKIQAYQLLCFFDTKTGQAIGHDLVTGHKNRAYFQDFQSRLHLINDQLVVEKTTSGEDFLCRGQKYQVYVGKYLGYKRLKKTSIEALTLPLKGVKKTIQGVDYQTYCNSQIGYCVDIPFKVFTYATYTGEEMPSEHFVSKDQQSLLMIKKKRFYYEDSLGRPDYQAYFKYHGYSKSPSDTINRLIKSRLYKDYCEFMVFSNNGLAFWEGHFFRKKHIIRVRLWYPQRQRLRYEKIARQIIKSFK